MEAKTDLLSMTADIAANFVQANKVGAAELPNLITTIHQSLKAIQSGGTQEATSAVEKLTTAQIKRSIKPDGLISFEDGRSYKTLRRHLKARGMTPDQYRQKWGLGADYPMVAPGYSVARSEMARAMGLGRKLNPAKPASRGRKSTK